MLKKLARSFIGSLLSLVIFTTLFSIYSDFSPDNIVDDIFGDIYAYANPSSQKKAVNLLSSQCERIEDVDTDITEQLKSFCNDPEHLC